MISVVGLCQTCFPLECRLPVNGGIHLSSAPPASSICIRPFTRTLEFAIFLFISIHKRSSRIRPHFNSLFYLYTALTGNGLSSSHSVFVDSIPA